MITEFIEKKLKKARYKMLKDGTYFAAVTGLRGVWANAKSLKACKKELREVLEDWLVLAVRDGEHIAGFHIKFDRRGLLRHA